jgi:hypothetical protein
MKRLEVSGAVRRIYVIRRLKVKLLCDDVGSEYETSIFHTKVRWLSRGKFMMTMFQVRLNLQSFV